MPTKLFHNALLYLLLLGGLSATAQQPVIRMPGMGRPTTMPSGNPDNRGRPGADTSGNPLQVERRDYSDDSLVVQVFHLSSPRPATLDTSIGDYTIRFPIPATHLFLGNDGSATRPLLFHTPPRIGWDPGFHSHDVYKWRPENARFFNTARPFTELGYMLGSRESQTIEVLHTQNARPYWNLSFHYRLLAAPGVFRNQKNNHNNIQFTSWYQSPGKRYNNYFVIVNNKVQAGESGGIRTDRDYLNDPVYERSRFTVPTNIGGDPIFGGRMFSTTLTTGRREREFNMLVRQQYDLGKKDSIVTDSTVIPLFYPRLRFEHNLRYGSYQYLFKDETSSGQVNNTPDSAYYKNNYGLTLRGADTVFLQDRWREVSNDFSVYQFPDAKNLQQYIKLGAELQLLRGDFRLSGSSLLNIIAHGEYRNRTKNQKWDINAGGRLYTAGYNIGDYQAQVSLQRLLGKELGTLTVGFSNSNRSPSFLFDQRSAFYLDTAKRFQKENTTHLYARYFIPRLGLQLNGDYYFVSNYLYLNGFRTLQQQNGVFNLLRVSGLKTFRLTRGWKLHAEVYVQQKAGPTVVNVPLLYTRNRLAYEGLLFRNLNLSTGLELRYHTPYRADNYSPVLGQFFFQDTLAISNRPDVHAFLHLRIRRFRAYVRVENLNTLGTTNGLRFNTHNFAAPAYPLPNLFMRFGIYWGFVN